MRARVRKYAVALGVAYLVVAYEADGRGVDADTVLAHAVELVENDLLNVAGFRDLDAVYGDIGDVVFIDVGVGSVFADDYAVVVGIGCAERFYLVALDNKVARVFGADAVALHLDGVVPDRDVYAGVLAGGNTAARDVHAHNGYRRALASALVLICGEPAIGYNVVFDVSVRPIGGLDVLVMRRCAALVGDRSRGVGAVAGGVKGDGARSVIDHIAGDIAVDPVVALDRDAGQIGEGVVADNDVPVRIIEHGGVRADAARTVGEGAVFNKDVAH